MNVQIDCVACSSHSSQIVLPRIYLTVYKMFNGECDAMVDMTFMRPLNEGQGHSFWYQSIPHMQLPVGC